MDNNVDGNTGSIPDSNMDNNTDTAKQPQNVVQRIQRKCEKKNYIEESDEEEIPAKKKKQQEIKKSAKSKTFMVRGKCDQKKY